MENFNFTEYRTEQYLHSIYYGRLGLCCVVSVPLGGGMLGVGAASLHSCSGALASWTLSSQPADRGNLTDTLQTPLSPAPAHIPVWLVGAGTLVLLAPVVYTVYDVFCKPETGVTPGH